MTELLAPLDFAFLDAQTFGDVAFAREIMMIFVEQVHQLLPTLANTSTAEQTATAHLLKGSCQGIGANAAADLLQRYDAAGPVDRNGLQPQLEAAFAAVEAAIEARLAAA